ncbi:MAG: MerR family transcriptional regulator [Thermodesulfobacteriota bacterium]
MESDNRNEKLPNPVIMKNQPRWYRIAEVERISGVSRRTIHFYLQQGLLHPPRKTGKTMAYYDDAHILKLGLIRNSKQEGVPLIAIKEKLAGLNLSGQAASGHPQPAPPVSGRRSDPGPRKRKTKGQKTRETILDIGCALFREKGYKGTKVSDIVSAMNVGKGTFYFYFTDKKELLLECVPRIFGELFSAGWDRIRKIQHPLKRLEMRARTVFPVLKEFCAIVQLSKEAIEDSDPKIHQLGDRTYRSICRPLEDDIRKGIETGLFQPVNTRVAAIFMIGIMENIYYLQRTDPTIQPERIWDGMLNLITHGIVGTGSNETPSMP